MKKILCITLLAFMLGGCALSVQNPGGIYTPVNAEKTESSPRLLLGGHDVVAYFREGRARPGDKAFSSRYGEVDLHFANAEHKALFDQTPQRYLPQFGGYCANGILYAIPMGGDPTFWRIYDDKLYIFGSEMSIAAFELDRQNNLKLAHSYWDQEIAGSNSFVQRARRMIFRVPHYRSTDEIRAAVAAANVPTTVPANLPATPPAGKQP